MSTSNCWKTKHLSLGVVPSYNLFGISNHSGTLFSGHYIAKCKHPFTHEWHEFNDASVHSIDDDPRTVPDNAYVLFYEQNKRWKNLKFSFSTLTNESFCVCVWFFFSRSTFSNACFDFVLVFWFWPRRSKKNLNPSFQMILQWKFPIF